ncbi:MAG: alcohol dehydrogenase [Candidatus Nitrosocaldaceae archaeon]|nr:MAG: alcohol dehydrogenase [Candidatus Nitrosocaldaceae archaeon]
MKAVVLHRHGGIEELQYQDYPDPTPNDGALIKVHACSLNHLDIWVREGVANKRIKFPHIPGSDISGELMNDINGLKKGSRVLIYPGLSCRRCKYCLEGRETLCKEFTIIGGLNDTQGGYAEYVKVPEDNIIPIPDWLSYEEAASINISYLTAWNMLEKVNAKDKTVLIYAAGSGVGSAAIQFAKALGCKIITTVGDASKIEKAKALGADLIIDRSKEDILTSIMKFTNYGVDAVIDHVGAKVWNINLQALRIGGELANCGATSGEDTNMNIRTFYNKQLTLYGIYLGTKKQLIDMLKFMEDNKIKPVIDSIFPLDKVREAHKKMEESKHFGKIVLQIV